MPTKIDARLPAVIIPAHNEEAVIADTLVTLLQSYDRQFDVIVVCNGCTDATAQRVKQSFPQVICEEQERPSKALAIRHAETLNLGFPRLYLDADIRLSTNDAELLIQCAKQTDQPIICVPVVTMLFDGVSPWVKRFYDVWLASSHVRCAGYGSGTYCLSQQARQQFGLWPELVADDGYVRVIIGGNAISVVDEAKVHVKPPKTWWSLLKVKTRSKLGRLELQQALGKKAMRNAEPIIEAKSQRSVSLISKLNYIVLNSLSLLWAYQRLLTGNGVWLRDLSNR